MISVHYLRRASRPLIQSIPPRARGTVPCLNTVSRGSSVTRVDCRASNVPHGRSLTTTSAAAGRFDSAKQQLEDESEHLSSFKKKRLSELREAQQGDDPLLAETHPRLEHDAEHDAERLSVPEFIAKFHVEPFEESAVNIYGRIRSMRVVGSKLVFLDIVNEFQRLQVMVNKSKCFQGEDVRSHKFRMWRNMVEVGDHISVVGIPTRTTAGELTLEAHQLPELISPTMEQIPEKLTDPKTRMQERHVDMLVNPQAIDILRLRAEITKHMRDHFHSKRFLEFQTPILAENAGGAVARPFITRATEFRNKDLALRIAPELWLKRLVIGGVDKVFEIGPAFRNEGVDATHNPEFTTCEFYSAYSNLSDLINETEELLYSLAEHSHKLISTQLTSLPPIDLARFRRPFKQVEFVPALEEVMGLRLPKLSVETALPELIAFLKLAGIHVPGEVPSSLAKLLDRLAAMYLEPMSFEQPILITNHPACMSPLAKSFLCPRTYQLVSARAELFIGGRELANMYEEENNSEEQRRKLNDHRNLVNMSSGEVGFDNTHELGEDTEPAYDDDEESAPLDQSFVKALDYGLPPTGGWGCGVDRLVMLFSGANRITDCLSFGTLRNVVGLSAEESKKTASNGEAKSEEQV
ncbi:hypothetical protein G7046_g1147 [Stylonectria norvegica]|nr:hypothetical protein G7046_g1147 [Stylonectria norvegica]